MVQADHCFFSVLNLEMFERQMKAEGLGMGAELASGGNQNLNDADFTCTLFRFLQLTCEGHNLSKRHISPHLKHFWIFHSMQISKITSEINPATRPVST